jgi:uncharacterized protein
VIPSPADRGSWPPVVQHEIRMASGNPLANLANLSMRQLRELARTLGIVRYSAESREGLAEAIAERAPATVIPAESPASRAADLRAIEAEMAPAPRPLAETRVVFLPRDPQWAYVFWEISEPDRQAALAAGASQLALRVADVTGLATGSSHPHTLQEVVVDSHATEWYLPVPLSDRDYRVEIGYRKGAGGGWISLAFSSVARVPALHPSEQILLSPHPSPPRSSPPTPASTSASTRAPRPAGAASDAARKHSMSSSSKASPPRAPASSPPAPGSGPQGAASRASVGWAHASAPSGWWPMPS